MISSMILNVIAELEFVEFQEHQGARGDLKYAIFSWPEQEVADDISVPVLP